MDKYDIIKLLNKTKPFSDKIFYFINNIIAIIGNSKKQIICIYSAIFKLNKIQE